MPSRRATLASWSAALTGIVCAGLLVAAVVVPAPVTVLPLVIVVCLGCPMRAAYDLAQARTRDPTAQLRRELERLPEAPHPLGL